VFLSLITMMLIMTLWRHSSDTLNALHTLYVPYTAFNRVGKPTEVKSTDRYSTIDLLPLQRRN
jgi:hypothetical protein